MLDDKRFPKKWHAAVGVALIQFVGFAAVIALRLILGNDFPLRFKTDFGYKMFLVLISQFISVLAIPLVILTATKCDMTSTLRLNKRIDIIQIFSLVIVCVGVYFAVQFINQFAIDGMTQILGQPSELESIPSASNIPQLLFEIAITSCLPAVCEEIFFRGFVMRAFERTSPVIAVIASSAMFAIMHANLEQLVYAFLLGIVLGTVTIVSDSLFASITVHFTLNLASTLLLYQPVSDAFDAFMLSESGVALVVLSLSLIPLIACVGMIIFVLYTGKKNTEKYGKAFVTDMEYPSLLQKQNASERLLYFFGWFVFIVVNAVTMYFSWRGI